MWESKFHVSGGSTRKLHVDAEVRETSAENKGGGRNMVCFRLNFSRAPVSTGDSTSFENKPATWILPHGPGIQGTARALWMGGLLFVHCIVRWDIRSTGEFFVYLRGLWITFHVPRSLPWKHHAAIACTIHSYSKPLYIELHYLWNHAVFLLPTFLSCCTPCHQAKLGRGSPVVSVST